MFSYEVKEFLESESCEINITSEEFCIFINNLYDSNILDFEE